MTRILAVFPAAIAFAAAGPAAAWGDLGHKVTALIAYPHLTPAACSKVDALLAGDGDVLAAPDFASRATWADRYREGHRATAAWHFVDIEIDHPDLKTACFGFPSLAQGQLSSQGPSQDCAVDKIEEFAAELRNSATPPAERLLAFKFLIHSVGDLHQPLHASDHDDRGGSCIALSPSPDGHSTNLHAWWDTGVVEAMGASPPHIAARLDAQISPGQAKAWAGGGPRARAVESFEVSLRDTYALPARPICGQHGSVALSASYQATARRDAGVQLERAGIRMAALLNRSL